MQVLKNAFADPQYAPYCMRCSTMHRMYKIEPFYWRCTRCNAQHDERGNLQQVKDFATGVLHDLNVTATNDARRLVITRVLTLVNILPRT